MKKEFIQEDFLLYSDTARQLYFDYAANLPIIDYHNHLPPGEISSNKRFSNMYELWLKGDHYKWRAMRANGIDEKYITGNASDQEKFIQWSATVPYTMRNPLYHWTHMELKKPFGISELLGEENAACVYERCNEQMKDISTQQLLNYFKVEALCTTDDPTDSLEHHRSYRKNYNHIKVLPTFRPDKSFAVENPVSYNEYLGSLTAISDREINSYSDLLNVIKERHDFFHETGCRLSDHGQDTFYADDFTLTGLERIFQKVKTGKYLEANEISQYKSGTLFFICEWNHDRNWVQQFHTGALRNNNSRLLKKAGADAGVDSMGDLPVAVSMSKFFDRLDMKEKLAKTIVYNNNPADNDLYATMMGNFQDGPIPGKMQFGSAWWFLDQKDGMENQINILSYTGLLSRFIGMTTDSRSFLSYSRHEYFRRILCNLIGEDIEKGILPGDINFLGKMVSNICYHNAKSYFNF